MADHRYTVQIIRSRRKTVGIEIRSGDLVLVRAPLHTPVYPRVQAWAGRIGVRYGRITIRNQKTRWGSCSSAGNLNFNCLLMLCPEEVRGYIIVHELCHRLEMNHSPRFWTEVAKQLPDYRQQQKWLRINGPALLARIRS